MAAPQAVQSTPIEPSTEADTHSVDSGYSESLCSTDSVRSSIYAYEQKYGRTYHAYHAGKYPIPNDEPEKERMDLHYHAMRLAIQDKLFHAPIQNPTSILDVGTGTGIWAMDAADTYPSSDVVGIDISPIQPSHVPPNLEFEVLDADDPWGYREGRFDLIHTRIMNGFAIKSWSHFYAEAFASLRPGGWVENQEVDYLINCDDGTMQKDSMQLQWTTLWNEAAEKIGMTAKLDPNKMMEQMKEAGFINTQVLPFKMPIGPWPKDQLLKESGLYGLVALLDGAHGMSVKLFKMVHGWTDEQLDTFMAGCKQEWKNKKIHSYWPMYVIIGQKPPAADQSGQTATS